VLSAVLTQSDSRRDREKKGVGACIAGDREADFEVTMAMKIAIICRGAKSALLGL
jgi:hypothetical protein